MNYECLKKYFTSKIREKNVLLEGMEQFAVAFGSGALSGTLAAAITTPFDVIKTRRQVALQGKFPQDPNKWVSIYAKDTFADGIKNNEAKSTYSMFHHIYQHEGWRGLTRGIVPRVIKVAPACAIMISSYELGKIYFNTRR